MNKNNRSEDDISVKCITPAIVASGWNEEAQIRHHGAPTAGRVLAWERLVGRRNPMKLVFVLCYQHVPKTLIEAKKCALGVDHGMQQALLTQCRDDRLDAGLDNVLILEMPPFSKRGTPLQLWREYVTKARVIEAVHEIQAERHGESAS